jgi:hypothetical protein
MEGVWPQGILGIHWDSGVRTNEGHNPSAVTIVVGQGDKGHWVGKGRDAQMQSGGTVSWGESVGAG